MKNLLWIIYLQLLRTVSCICDSTSSDVCKLYNNQELPHIYSRHPSTGHSSLTEDTKYCDFFALKQNTWYRSSYNLVTECVDHRMCGTEDPIWLNGTLPDESDGTVDGTGCVRTVFDCCEQSLNLKIRNCTYYMVYCFTDIHANCHSRYCLDTDLSIESTTTSPATTTAAITSVAATTCKCEDCKCPKDRCIIIIVVLGIIATISLGLNVIGVFICIKYK